MVDKFILVSKIVNEMRNWKAALDIFLIAALIFLIYRTFRRLGTWRILLGILTAAAIFMLASILELWGISWIYSNLSQVAVLGIIVIFQPEIRKVFERAVSLRRNEIGEKGSNLSLLVSNALFDIARQKRGSLMVFPGKEPVKEWLSEGFILDAQPSFPLLVSIFDPNSPGHDGALIIENGKFSTFGVRLPNSKSERLSKTWGTRHHAAMGLSEMTDALVVVVSEERSTITVFSRGRMKHIDQKKDLIDILESHWEKTASYLPTTLLAPYKLKLPLEILASSILAFLFWTTLAVSHVQLSERTLVVPIEYAAIPQHLVLTGNRPTEIKLRLAGAKPDLDALKTSQVMVKIDLSKTLAGKQTLAITEENILLPKRFDIMEIEPSSLTISLEEILMKELIIKPQLVGKLPQGLELASVDVSPSKIFTMSPVGLEKNKDAALTTTPIYLESIYQDTVIFCKIISPADILPADKRWPDVHVQIKVRFKGENKK